MTEYRGAFLCDIDGCPSATGSRRERGWWIYRDGTALCPSHATSAGLRRLEAARPGTPPTQAFYEAQATLYEMHSRWRAEAGRPPLPMPTGLARYLSTKESSLW